MDCIISSPGSCRLHPNSSNIPFKGQILNTDRFKGDGHLISHPNSQCGSEQKEQECTSSDSQKAHASKDRTNQAMQERQKKSSVEGSILTGARTKTSKTCNQPSFLRPQELAVFPGVYLELEQAHLTPGCLYFYPLGGGQSPSVSPTFRSGFQRASFSLPISLRKDWI